MAAMLAGTLVTASLAVGMLYVALPDPPLLEPGIVLTVAVPLLFVAAVVALAGWKLGGRLGSSIRGLSRDAARITRGDPDVKIVTARPSEETAELAKVLGFMQAALDQRDHELKVRSQVLAKTNARLEAVNRNYMETLGFVTHELKSPMATVQTIGMGLSEGIFGELPEDAGRRASDMVHICEELQDMIKNYLDLSRVERGELTASPRQVSFRSDVVDPVISLTAVMFDSRNVTLTAHCPEGLTVRADPELIRIALGNYLTNAAKYGREGGKAELDVVQDEGGRQVTATVWNEGAGFTEEQSANLFQQFSRLANENTRIRRGSGLGLFICKQILELHNGRVWAESEQDQWARFSFSFPSGGE